MLSNQELIDLLKKDVQAFNEYREDKFIYPTFTEDYSLEGADFSGANLTGANLHNLNLNFAVFRRCVLSDVGFERSNLSHAVFERACLDSVDFEGAFLPHSLFKDALLKEAFFEQANLAYADLRDMRWASGPETRFNEACLVGVQTDCKFPAVPELHEDMLSVVKSGKLNQQHCPPDWRLNGNGPQSWAQWAVYFAGEAAMDLAMSMSDNAVAAFIYMASDPSILRVPDFDNIQEEAVKDIERLAECRGQ